MGIQVPPQVSLHTNAEKVPPIGNRKIEKPFADVRQDEKGHHPEERPVLLVGQQGIQGLSGGIGKGQINQTDQKSTAHIQNKKMLVRAVIRQKNF